MESTRTRHAIWTPWPGCGNKRAMTQAPRPKPPKSPKGEKAARLKAALRENLKRRKAQTRARNDGKES